MTTSVQKFLRIHHGSTDQQRLGQRFCNMFLKNDDQVPQLYYEQNDERSIMLINKWLEAHHYFTQLPPILDSYTQAKSLETK